MTPSSARWFRVGSLRKRRALIQISVAVLAYVSIVAAVVASSSDWGVNDGKPAFSTLERGTFPNWSPDSVNTSLLEYRPKAFDEDVRRLSVEIQYTPAMSIGESEGNSFLVLGNNLSLSFAGGQVGGSPYESRLYVEGVPGVLSYRYIDVLKEISRGVQPGEYSEEFISQLETNALRSYADRVLRPPFDVSVQADTSERGFASRDNIFWYPFDSYGFTLNLQGVVQPTVDIATEELNVQDAPLRTMGLNVRPDAGSSGGRAYYAERVGEWNVRSRPTGYLSIGFEASPDEVIAGWRSGLGSVAFLVERTFAGKILALIYGLIYLVSMAALLVVIRQIACEWRPPTGNMLVWAAALVFASVSLRQGLPGSVPIGTLFDWVFYFPALLTAIACTLYLAIKWVQRDDYTP